MKKVRVNEWQVALVFKNGAYKKMLLAGNYWFWKNEDIFVYDITKQFVAPVELNILLQDQSLAEILQVIEVKENEIVLQYENGLLKQVLSAGRYAFWKSVVKNEFIRADISQVEIDLSIDRTTLSKAPLNNWVRSTEVQSNEKGVLFMDAKMVGLLEPGIYYWWKNQVSIQVAKTDMRKLQLEVNGQEILTRDKAALRLNAWLQYQVTDIVKALVENKEYDKQLYVAVQLALREYIAVYSFDELLEKKESLAPFV